MTRNDPPSEILPHLLLGSLNNARSKSTLSKFNVSHILNVNDSAKFLDSEEIHYSHIPISDYGDTNLYEVFDRCFQVILEARDSSGRVLVHCRHGSNRSPTIVLAYLVKHENMSLKDAYGLVTMKRENVLPHGRYLETLQDLERNIHGLCTLSKEDVGPTVQEVVEQLRAETGED